ncbi:MAG: hypothetical protein ACOCQD_03135 [archaeon]
MDNYTVNIYRDSFDDFVNYLSSNVAHFFNQGEENSLSFGDTNSQKVENENNPLKMAIILNKDKNFNDIITSQGISENVTGIALMSYRDIDKIPYTIKDISKSRDDSLVELDLELSYKITDYSFVKLGSNIIGLIFVLDKV